MGIFSGQWLKDISASERLRWDDAFAQRRRNCFSHTAAAQWFHVLRDCKAISSDLADTSTNNQQNKRHQSNFQWCFLKGSDDGGGWIHIPLHSKITHRNRKLIFEFPEVFPGAHSCFGWGGGAETLKREATVKMTSLDVFFNSNFPPVLPPNEAFPSTFSTFVVFIVWPRYLSEYHCTLSSFFPFLGHFHP